MSEIRSQATPARDELAGERDALAMWLAGYGIPDVIAEGAATAFLNDYQRKPHTVNTAADLDALPVGSVILVDAGRYGLSAWQKHTNGRWCEASHCEESMTSTELRAGNLPTAVLFTPGDAG